VAPAFSEQHVAAIVESNPLRRMSEFDELGRLSVFLVSDLARCITGQFIIADAGAFLSGAGPGVGSVAGAEVDHVDQRATGHEALQVGAEQIEGRRP